jgi:tRNA threonylcarbamoyladenosine biosynthesis protein TsaB
VRILAFDTATRATTVALADGELIVEARDDPAEPARPGHTRLLLGLIEEVLEGSGAGWEAVDRLAVGVGPGTFTGLRIGIATAHALARARSLPLVGVSTLRSLAVGARDAGQLAGILSLLDARRGEGFAAAWAAGSDPTHADPVLAPLALAPEGLAAAVAQLGPGAIAVGDGAVKFRAILERAGAGVPPDASALHRVTARAHCRLAIDLSPAAPDAVLPAYLRLPDAEIARQ